MVHVTDGLATDGDPRRAAAALRGVRTQSGATVLVNVVLAPGDRPSILFPSKPAVLPDPAARAAFDSATTLPSGITARLAHLGYRLPAGARALMAGGGVDRDALSALALSVMGIATHPARCLDAPDRQLSRRYSRCRGRSRLRDQDDSPRPRRRPNARER